MTKTATKHLLSFCVGSALTLAAVTGVSRWPWQFKTFDGPDLARAGSIWPAFSVTSIVLASLIALSAALLVSYWGEAAVLANRLLRKTGQSATEFVTKTRARPAVAGADVTSVRDQLEWQLGRLIVLIAGQLEISKEQITSLKNTNAYLATVTDANQVREVVKSLISKNEQSQRDTSQLEMRLKEAQAQATSLRQRLTQAEKLAALDPLTSVANRRRFEMFIVTEVERSHEDGTPLCLIMTDIDHFKVVNDTHGHSAGDKVLKAFADLLSKSVRGNDLVARYGGEEFAIVLPRTPMGNAFDIAERIRAKFEICGGHDESITNEFGRLTASFGVAEIRDGEPPSALIERADQMLYEAKRKGRNRTAIWGSAIENPVAPGTDTGA